MPRLETRWGLGFVYIVFLCARAAGQPNISVPQTVAKFTVNVMPRNAAAPTNVPGIEMVRGKPVRKLGPDENQQTIGINIGTVYFLALSERARRNAVHD
jgi:hypothetical protein